MVNERTNFEHVSTKRNNDSPQMNATRNETPTTVEQILKEYPDVFDLNMFKEAPKHEDRDYIPTRGTPFCGKVRRMSSEKLQALRQELDHLLELGVIAESPYSPWGSPCHLVAKHTPPGEPKRWRLVADYRVLNSKTIPDQYSLPLLTDFTDSLAGCSYF